jgi:hypothetical protein
MWKGACALTARRDCVPSAGFRELSPAQASCDQASRAQMSTICPVYEKAVTTPVLRSIVQC